MMDECQLDQGGETVCGSSNKTEPRISIDLHQQLPRVMQGVGNPFLEKKYNVPFLAVL